jgi:hypothetical protein
MWVRVKGSAPHSFSLEPVFTDKDVSRQPRPDARETERGGRGRSRVRRVAKLVSQCPDPLGVGMRGGFGVAQDRHAAFVDLAQQSKKFQVTRAFERLRGGWGPAGEALRGVPLGWESSAARMAAFATVEQEAARKNAQAWDALSHTRPLPQRDSTAPLAAAVSSATQLHALPKLAHGASLGLYGPN